MVEFKNTNGIYMGKIMGSDGAQKKDTSKLWRLWKLQFKPSEESEKSFTMSKFQNGKKEGDVAKWDEMSSMNEGDWYYLTYKSEMRQGDSGEYESKTLHKFEAGKKDIPSPAQQDTKIVDDNVSNELDWEDFAKSYDEASKGATFRHPLHMLGVFIATNSASSYADLIAKCKKHFQ